MPIEHDAIRQLTARAFAGQPYSNGEEPAIVDGLRRANALASSLVAVLDGQIVGHVAFSPLETASPGWFALGPVSVEPALQRRGIGTRLIETGLAGLRARGARGCVLLGDHRYYRRFGFSPAPELAPPGCPAEHFQILAFGATRPQGRVAFHAAFATTAS